MTQLPVRRLRKHDEVVSKADYKRLLAAVGEIKARVEFLSSSHNLIKGFWQKIQLSEYAEPMRISRKDARYLIRALEEEVLSVMKEIYDLLQKCDCGRAINDDSCAYLVFAEACTWLHEILSKRVLFLDNGWQYEVNYELMMDSWFVMRRKGESRSVRSLELAPEASEREIVDAIKRCHSASFVKI